MPADDPNGHADGNQPNGRTLTAYAGVLLALAAWALLSVVVFEGPAVETLDDVLVGGGFLALAGYNYYVYRTGDGYWLDAPRVAVLVGIWLVPFSLHVGTGGRLMVDSILLGVVAALVNVYFYRRFRGRAVGGADH